MTPGRRSAVRAVRLVAMLVAACLACGAGPARAAPATSSEYEVKAAFLYNFAKFVEWPPDAFARGGTPLVIGVLGEDPFGSVLDGIVRGKQVQGRPVVVRRFATVEEAAASHVLFISPSEDERLAPVLARLRQAPVLTVGETERFAERGGVIGLRLEGGRVRFDVNVDAAQRARLGVSSQLLKLARVVRGEPGRAP